MSTRQRSLAALLAGLLLCAGAATWLLLGGKGIVDETLAVQGSLLDGDRTARDRTSGVTRVTRNIDRMDREDVKKVRAAFMAQWRRLQRQSVTDYLAAREADRESLLDRDIDRLVTAGQLWFATQPRSNGQPPKPSKAKQAAQKSGTAEDAEAAQRFDSYRDALLDRAKKRSISAPEWLLDGPR